MLWQVLVVNDPNFNENSLKTSKKHLTACSMAVSCYIITIIDWIDGYYVLEYDGPKKDINICHVWHNKRNWWETLGHALNVIDNSSPMPRLKTSSVGTLDNVTMLQCCNATTTIMKITHATTIMWTRISIYKTRFELRHRFQ